MTGNLQVNKSKPILSLKLFRDVAMLDFYASTRPRRQTNKMAFKDGRGSKYTGASYSSTAQKINPECNSSCNTEIKFRKQTTLIQSTN
jgi:hypothetical protein